MLENGKLLNKMKMENCNLSVWNFSFRQDGSNTPLYPSFFLFGSPRKELFTFQVFLRITAVLLGFSKTVSTKGLLTDKQKAEHNVPEESRNTTTRKNCPGRFLNKVYLTYIDGAEMQ